MTAQSEQESIEVLTSLMGDGDPEVARRVYRKFNGDMNRAATAILEGDTGESEPGTAQRPGTPMTGLAPHAPANVFEPPPPLKPSPVIDLTGDDDAEMARALQVSLETPSNTQIGPSERSKDEWQVAVRSQGNSGPNPESGTAVSHDDQQMSRAIQESLEGSFNQVADDLLEALPPADNLRKDKRPIALRPTQANYVYATMIIQALFFIPQVRIAVSRFRPSTAVEATPDPDEIIMWGILELFANMDLVCTAELLLDRNDIIDKLDVQGWTSPTDQPGRLSNAFYVKITELIEQCVSRVAVTDGAPSRPKGRMFNFSYGHADGIETSDLPDVTSIVQVTVGNNGSSHDLVSCLSAQFAPSANEPQNWQNVILECSDIVAFELLAGSRGGTADKKPFSYPKVIYLDQFMQENAEIAQAARVRQREMLEEADTLTLRKKSLTSFNNKNTLKDLRSTVYYYEEVADAKGDATRQADIDRTCQKLKHILASIENEVKAIDAKITELKSDSQTLFDVPEMQIHEYNLRAVLVHDGLFGRKSLYSYVQDQGKWWKTIDASVTEVTEETVLTDPTGLHLGAGPYLLLYSRQVPSTYDQEIAQPAWPPKLRDGLIEDNQVHLAQLRVIGIDVDKYVLPPASFTTENDEAMSEKSSVPMVIY
ncbi:hypothetical protein FIBSPDRAFT_869788 [Athelia psychrophila]|uniref:Peptidase C19 ubiquitin carboxyl-terminal hydrolase domain-containing protein n=1 Tax=Athelia psychrophila TaxID=1759441 RepID=A0A166BSD2_9AGAM|nr:hypothetical protein FIBSPDRAFT_869788 [Fibularhizoctonia sp. CBS 109695]